MTTFLIPLQNVPQKFEIALAGTNYILNVRWNDAVEAGWIMDISIAVSNQVLACNIPFVTGTDLLSGLEYLGISGKLIIYTDGNQLAVPTLTNLGVESNLYFQTEVAV